MDGNRRWAKNRMLPPIFGHKAALNHLADNCRKFGVQVLTVFAFSTENWARPKEEVDHLMRLFEDRIRTESYKIKRYDLRVMGDKERFPESVKSLLCSVEDSNKSNKGMRLVMGINYSGRYDITQASKKIAAKVRDGVLRVEDINEDIFGQHLETGSMEYPNPDLLIRTSGELRISNFMLWQLAYSELFFSDKLFPDFDEEDLIQALRAFQQRQRRYGAHKYPNQEE